MKYLKYTYWQQGYRCIGLHPYAINEIYDQMCYASKERSNNGFRYLKKKKMKDSDVIQHFEEYFTRVTLMGQELLIFPKHMSSLPVFLWGSSYSIFSFMCMFCRSLFVLLTNVLSLLLRFTDSDYPFGIFKLFLEILLLYNAITDH